MPNNEPRIIAGTAKNTKLKVAPSSRPVTERVRQSIFDLLTGHLAGKSCIDLYAGAGSLGLEALSRGASSCIFVEKNDKAISALRDNIESAGFSEQSTILSTTVHQVLSNPTEFGFDQVDIIFIDPPFKDIPELKTELLLNIMHQQSLVIFRIQSEVKIEIPDELSIIEVEDYGESSVIFLSRIQPDSSSPE